MNFVWVLECVNMLCGPPAELRRVWVTKDECRAAVMTEMNKMPKLDRFTWRCISIPPIVTTPEPSFSAESLERP